MQIFSFLLLLYNSQENYNLISGNNYRMVTKNGVLLDEDFESKKIFLMISGMSGWKKLYWFVEKHAGSGGFLTHIGKKSCYFSLNYDLSLPFNMMAVKVKDREFLVRYYLSMRRNIDKYFGLIENRYEGLVEFLVEIDKKLVQENKIDCMEDSNQMDFRLFSQELLKTLSPIFDSYNRRHDKHFAIAKDLKSIEKIIDQMSKKIQYIEEKYSLLEEKLKKENASWKKDIKYLAEKLTEYEISDVDQKKVNKVLKRAMKKNKEPLIERIPKSSICPWLRKDVIDNFF